jgi:hypothetical protein
MHKSTKTEIDKEKASVKESIENMKWKKMVTSHSHTAIKARELGLHILGKKKLAHSFFHKCGYLCLFGRS